MTLVALLLIPLLGGIVAAWCGRWSASAARTAALGAMVGALGLSLVVWTQHDFGITSVPGVEGVPSPWVLEYRAPWIPALGASIHLGLDGLSLLLVVLTNLLGVFAVLVSTREAERSGGFFYLSLLWNVAAVVGVFLALDLLLFFFFWEMMLIPMFFLIAVWGQDQAGGLTRNRAALKFFLFGQASGLLLLVSTLGLVYLHYRATGELTFDYDRLLGTTLPPDVAWWLMFGFFLAFALKLPIVPLHTWLGDAHCAAPPSGSVDLAGLLLKTAAYGMLRFTVPLFPEAALTFANTAMWLGVLTIVYGAVVAFSQHDLKRLVAYTGISHLGFVVVGIFAGTGQALTGVVLQMVAHALSAGALFLLCGEIQARLGTRDLRQLGGLAEPLPRLGSMVMFFAIASLGLPGLGNFVAEVLILSGTFAVAPVIAIGALSGLILSVAYALLMVQRALHGEPVGAGGFSDGAGAGPLLADLSARTLGLLLVLVTLLVGLGLYPQPVIDLVNAPLHAIEAGYRGFEFAPVFDPAGASSP